MKQSKDVWSVGKDFDCLLWEFNLDQGRFVITKNGFLFILNGGELHYRQSGALKDVIIGHKSCNMLSILNKLTLQNKLQNLSTNNVFWTRK